MQTFTEATRWRKPTKRKGNGRNYAQQRQVIPGKSRLMTSTSSGTKAFKVDDWGRLARFLILGADKPTFYATKRQLVRDNARVVERCIKEDGIRTVDLIAEVSIQGSAPNNDPALFALAMCATLGGLHTRQYALGRLSDVARIGTHLFHFVAYCEGLGHGWGRNMRRAIRGWYNEKAPDKLAYQILKYKQRDGWSHKDLLALAHPRTSNKERDAIYRYIVAGIDGLGKRTVLKHNGRRKVRKTYPDVSRHLPAQIFAAHDVHKVSKRKAKQLIEEHRMTHEMVPNELKNDPEVWEIMLETMPIGAMVRNLGKMTSIGLLDRMSRASKLVIDRLGDMERIRRARLHPIEFLKANRVYGAGRGDKGSLCWDPVRGIVRALDDGFYLAFGAIEPSGVNTGLFIDVSGSMAWDTSRVKSMANMTARELSGAMALVTANVEPYWEIIAFSGGYDSLEEIPIEPGMKLDTVVNRMERMRAGSTNLSLPFEYARGRGVPIETFIVYTDNETNHFGSLHPSEALRRYRKETGIDAKLIVVGMVANDISIADPTDHGMLDVVGFDTNAPSVMADFAKGAYEIDVEQG